MIFSKFLEHYASKYYDPVKAHEYYMRTRELVGRRSARNLNKEGKQTWKYVRTQILEERKQQMTNIRNQKKVEIQSFRESAKVKQKAITDSIKQEIEILPDPEEVKKIPKGASKALRERYSKINAQIRERNSKLSVSNKDKKDQIREAGALKRDTIREQVTQSIASAKEMFNTRKTEITEKYDNILDDEYNNILNSYGRSRR